MTARYTLVFLTVVGLFVCAYAETRTWKGGTPRYTQNWATPQNWEEGQVPTADDDVVIPAAVKATPQIVSEKAVKSLVAATNLEVNARLTVAGPMTICGGATVTVGAEVTIGGNLVLESGAVVRQRKPSYNTGTKILSKYICDLTVGGDVTLATGASVDVVGLGYWNVYGESYTNKAAGVHGGIGGVRDDLLAYKAFIPGTCYDSIFSPVDYGGSGPGSTTVGGGGAFVLKATGTLTHNGTISADAANPGSIGRWTAAGGTVSIRAGRLVGSGSISANGMTANYTPFTAGGGGRISLVLTEAGANFSQYTGAVTAYGGCQVSTTKRTGGAGTIYRQTGDEEEGAGTIYVSNGSEGTMATEDFKYEMAGLGYPGMDDLSKATVVLGPNSGLYLYSDCTIGKLRFEGTTATEPASVNFNGHTLTVNEPKPTAAEWTDPAKYKFQNVYNGTIARKGASNLLWKKSGLVFLIK